MSITDIYQLGHSEVFELVTGEEAVVNLELKRIPAPANTVLSGRVVSGGIPISAATVKVLDTNYNPVTHTLTDSKGAYRFGNVLQPGSYKLTAAAQGFMTAETIDFTLNVFNEETIDIELVKDASGDTGFIYGNIIDFSTHKTVEDAIVSLYQADLWDNNILVPTMQTISNDAGQYLLCNINPGLYFITASKPGYHDASPIFIQVEQGKITKTDIEMVTNKDASAGTISGIIRGDGKTLSSVYVGLYQIDGDGETLIQTKITNNEGLYLFPNVRPGNYVVKAKLESGLYFVERFFV